jgi:hypothetical protein
MIAAPTSPRQLAMVHGPATLERVKMPASAKKAAEAATSTTPVAWPAPTLVEAFAVRASMISP